MNTHTITLRDDELTLVRMIRQIDRGDAVKKDLIDELIRQIEDFMASQPSKKPVKWLQVGDKTCFRPITPVKPKAGAPLASDIILEQRTKWKEYET